MSEALYAQMKQTVIDGEVEDAERLAQEGLDAGLAAGDILDKGFVKGIEEVGDLFGLWVLEERVGVRLAEEDLAAAGAEVADDGPGERAASADVDDRVADDELGSVDVAHHDALATVARASARIAGSTRSLK